MGTFVGSAAIAVAIDHTRHRLPEPAAVQALAARLEAAAEDAEALFHWCAGLDYPTDHQVFTSVALSHPEDYAIEAGSIISGGGLHIDIGDYEDWFELYNNANEPIDLEGFFLTYTRAAPCP